MNFNYLKVFRAAAKNLNYSRAAEELYISQPTVSIQVKKLEEELGLDLFEQFGKKIYLTQAGELLYSYANKIFALAEDAKATIEELKGLKAGRLLIGASTTPGIYLLPAIIASFQETYPNLEISLEISNTHAVQERLLANQLDLGIVGEELLVDPNLHVEALTEDELVIIAAPNNPLTAGKPVVMQDVLDQRLILRERGSSTREVLEEKIREIGGRLKVSMQLGSVEAIKQAVAANLGISVVSKFAIALEVSTGVLQTLTVPGLHLARQINLVYHKDKRLSKGALGFISYLKNAVTNQNVIRNSPLWP